MSEECELYNGKGDEENVDKEDEDDDDDDSNGYGDRSTSEDKKCDEVTKKISELEVANDKD